jgi:hypothetical protein
VCSFYQARLLFHDADATIKQPAKTNKGLSARDKTVFQRASARRCSQSVVENRGQKDRKLIATKSRQNKKKMRRVFIGRRVIKQLNHQP